MADCRLMLHLNGADASTTITDEMARHTVTCNGSAQLDTAQKKWGTASLLLDGTGDYLSIPNSEDWNIAAVADEDWTIDFWVKHADHAGTEKYIVQYEDATNYWEIEHADGSGMLFQLVSGGAVIIATTAAGEITDTNWHHIALCRVADEYGLYLDGAQIGYTQDASLDTLTGSLYVGANGAPASYFDGWIDELRIDKHNHFGAAPNVGKTDTITEPTAEYADWQLLHVFPTITGKIDAAGYTRSRMTDSVRRSDPMNGYVIRKSMFTWRPKQWKYRLRVLTETDMDNIQTFEDAIDGGERPFIFNDTRTLTSHVVWLDKGCLPLSFELEPGNKDRWMCNMVLNEHDQSAPSYPVT